MPRRVSDAARRDRLADTLPGLVVAVGNPKAFAPSKSRKSQAQAAFFNLLFFGIPMAVWYANWCIGIWNWPSRF